MTHLDYREKDTATGLLMSLGSINADFQVRVGRRPEISETLLGDQFARLSGGKAANVSYLARKLGLQTLLLGHVGDDDLAEQALRPLRAAGVNLSGVRKVAGAGTGVAMITVPPDGKKGIVLAANANHLWQPEDIAEVVSIIEDAPEGAVLVLDCEVPPDLLEEAATTALGCGVKIILDPSPAENASAALIATADIITPNAGEAEQLTGVRCNDIESAAQAGRVLEEQGARAACVRLPDGGCVLVEKHHTTVIRPVPLQVIDTTGAGDAFTGALAVAVAENRPLPDAVRFAVAASHLAVTRYGSQAALPDRAQIEQMYGQLSSDDFSH